MFSRADPRAWAAVRAPAGVGASALLCTLAFPPWSLPALSWLALVPALAALDARGTRSAASLGLLHGTLMAAGVSAWLVPTVHGYFGRPLGGTLVFLVAFWVAAVGLQHAALFAGLSLARRALPRGAWLVLVPLAWVAMEWLRSTWGLRCAWARLGDAHWESERLRQLASLTGVYGPSAVVVAVNVTLLEAWRSLSTDAAWRRLVPHAVALAVLALAVGLHGERRLEATRDTAAAAGLDVLLVQADVPSDQRWDRVHTSRVLRRYGGLTREALRAGGRADLVVWPEQALQLPPDDPSYGPTLQAFVDRLEAPLLLGAPRTESESGVRRTYNTAFLLAPGAAFSHYDKQRLLPFSESHPFGLGAGARGPGAGARSGNLAVAEYSAGRRPGLLDWDGPRLGVLICFEAVYAELARALALGGARVIVNVANDGWLRGRGGAEQHLAQVVFRAVETGLPVVRATSTGISALVAPDGRILARLPAGRSDTLRVDVRPGGPAPTFYARWGDAFALGCTALTLLAVTAGALGRARRAPAALRAQSTRRAA